MFNRVEPVFVIVDDFSAFGSNYGLDYKSGKVNHDGKSVDVCLFDYGFIDFIGASGPTLGTAKYHNISNFDQAVLDEITYQWGSQVSASANVGQGQNINNSTWIDYGAISDQNGSIYGSWLFTPTADNLGAGTFGQADAVSYTAPAHGEFVFDQFLDKLSPQVADNSNIILVDIDFGDDLAALTQNNYS